MLATPRNAHLLFLQADDVAQLVICIEHACMENLYAHLDQASRRRLRTRVAYSNVDHGAFQCLIPPLLTVAFGSVGALLPTASVILKWQDLNKQASQTPSWSPLGRGKEIEAPPPVGKPSAAKPNTAPAQDHDLLPGTG